jgi:hypothetical protein
MNHEIIALLALAATLLGTVVASTWRFSALASKLLVAYEQQREKNQAVDERLKTLETRIGQLERNHSLIPRLENRVVAVEQAAKFSKEWRSSVLTRGSRPDSEDD